MRKSLMTSQDSKRSVTNSIVIKLKEVQAERMSIVFGDTSKKDKEIETLIQQTTKVITSLAPQGHRRIRNESPQAPRLSG